MPPVRFVYLTIPQRDTVVLNVNTGDTHTRYRVNRDQLFQLNEADRRDPDQEQVRRRRHAAGAQTWKRLLRSKPLTKSLRLDGAAGRLRTPAAPSFSGTPDRSSSGRRCHAAIQTRTTTGLV